MRKARFTEHQIIAVIKSVEAGRTVKHVCREAGISEATYYNWKSRYGGMEASDIKKIKDLEDEIEIDLNLPALRVVRVLDRIAAIRSCYALIMVRNLSHWHWLNGQRNMQ